MTPPGTRDRKAWLALVALLTAFTVLKIAAIRPGSGDEFIYLYMGKLVADGKVPYRDFFFTHPPLRLVPPAVVFATAGFSFTALKLVPILVTDATAALLWQFGRRAASPFVGVVAAALFLFSTTGQTFGGLSMGQELTVLLIVVGLVAVQRGRPVVAGVSLGLAMLAGVYAACAAAVCVGMLVRRDRASAARFVAGFVVVYGAGTAACFLAAGRAYWEQTFVFQTLKVEDQVYAKWPIVGRIALLDPAVLVLACFAPRRSGVDLPAAVGGAYALALLAFPNIHLVYAELLVPFLTVPAAAGLVALADRVRVGRVAPTAAASACVVVLAAVAVVRSGGLIARSEQYPIRELADEVRTLTPPGETVFGDASVTPLLALLADRRIVADCVDTTGMNYLVHAADLRDVMRRMGPDWPGVVVVRNTFVPDGPASGVNVGSGPMMDPDFAAFVYAHFTPARTVPRADDPSEAVLLLVRNERTPGLVRPR